MREGGLCQSVMLCGRGLRTAHMHRPITTYFLAAKIVLIFETCKKTKENLENIGFFTAYHRRAWPQR